MTGQPDLDFAGLLRQLRAEARLTQEELAQAAGLSPRAVSDLERGLHRTAHKDTAVLLAEALSLSGQVREVFVAAARGKAPAWEVLAARREMTLDPSAASATRAASRDAHVPGRRAEPCRPWQSLPVPADSFIGRDREVADVREAVRLHRLVTLTGPGGSGKTRLATEVASRLAANSAGWGICFVDASPLSEAGLIPDRMAHVTGVRPAPGQATTEALAHALAQQDLLVVLDNLEHLTGAARVVAQLLQVVPGLRLLVTSRSSLHVRGEQLYPVPPLALSGPDVSSPEPGERAAAVALFADRAAAADPRFEITAQNATVVVEICRRLDGLPLAIELAASWVRMLPPTDLLPRLDRRLDLLAEVDSDRPGRQQTLRATIDWSYQLLSERARRTFRALAVFRAGWTVTAALAVCDHGDEVALLSELAELTDKSLIEPVRPATAMPRFRMLETLRAYGLEQLARCGELELRRDRHADYIHSLASASAPQLTGPRQVAYLDMLETERDDIADALRRLATTKQVERGLRTAALLWRFWHLRAHLREGRALLEALLAAPATQADPVIRADGIAALGSVAYWQLDFVTADCSYREALALYQQAAAQAEIARSHYDLGFTAVQAGEHEQARQFFSQALAGYEQLADDVGRLNALSGLALVDRATGNYERARDRLVESLADQRRLDDEFGAINSLSLLGSVTSRMGLLDEAEALLREALAAHEQAGNVSGIIWMLHELAETAASGGKHERAALLSGAAHALEGELGGGAGLHVLGLGDQPPIPAGQQEQAKAASAQALGRLMNRQQAVAAALAND